MSHHIRCRLCPCTGFLPIMPGRDECACGHSEGNHRAPEPPSISPRFCESNRRLFATTDNPPTVRSNCTFCNRPYFVHPNDQTEPNFAPTTPHIPSLLSTSGTQRASSNTLLLSGTSALSPLAASAGSSTGSNVSLQAYLRPLGSPSMSTSAASLPSNSLTQHPSLQVAPLSPWNPPGPPPAGSTNDRRMNRAASARHTGSTRGLGVAASPFRPLTPGHHHQSSVQRVQSRRTASSSRLPHGVSMRKYVVVIHPEPAHGTILTQSGRTFSTLRAPIPQKIAGFLDQAIPLNLVFTFEYCAEDNDPAGRQLDAAIHTHLSRYGFRFSQALPLDGTESMDVPRSLTRSIPSASSTPLLNSHTPPTPSEDNFEWNFLTSHKGQRKEAVGAKLTSSPRPVKDITFSELDKIGSRVPRPPAPYQEFLLLFVLPTGRNVVVGPLQGHGNSHLCLAMHLWNGFTQASLDEVRRTIECSDQCSPSMAPLSPDLGPQLQVQESTMSFLELLAEGPRPPSHAHARLGSPARSLSPSLSPLAVLSHLPVPPEQPSSSSSPDIVMLPTDAELHWQAIPATDALREWHQQINRAIAIATEPFTTEETRIRITADTPHDAAQGFFDSCLSWCSSAFGFGVSNNPRPIPLPPQTTLRNCNPTTITFNDVSVSIGDGVGDGPLRSFWAALMDLITKRSNHWQQVGDDGYYAPVITSFPPSDEDLQAFRAYGLILRTGFVWGMDLLPISPAVICYLISNYETVTAPAFLQAILPQTFSRLTTWPPPLINDEITGSSYLRIIPAADPYTMILEYDGNISINQLRFLSPAQCSALYEQLVAFMVFKSQAAKGEQGHPIYSALSLAFNERVYSGTQFRQSFSPISTDDGISPTSVIIGLFGNRTVSSSEQILGLLRPTTSAFTSDRIGFDPVLDYPALSAKWMLHLSRYLRGIGVPRGPDDTSLFDKEDNRDPSFRSKLFLRCVTGSNFLPVDPAQKIGVKFIIHSAQPWAAAVGLHIHTCFFTIDVILNAETARIIDQDILADVSVTTDFDRWIHSAVGGTASSVYNTV